LDSRDQEIRDALKAQGNLPKHVAIIMDGNGRWAQSQGLARTAGHRSARDVVRDIVRACGELQIEILTLFTFGTDNWKRPWSEVLALMKLLRDSSSQELAELQENNVKLMATGNTDRLAKQAHRALTYAISQTAKNTGLTLNLALSYDGRSDIVNAARRLAKEVANGGLDASQIDDEKFAEALYTGGLADPDLLIRTSGEMRMSNFMLWQCAYTELWFSPVLWPDFRREHLYEAIEAYQSRERRFGKTSAQVSSGDEVGTGNGVAKPPVGVST
jgi:undecaprenyl diphosphate synthase